MINNGINLDVFKPVKSDFRKKYGIEDKYLLLGVGYNWSPRKGLDSFIELSKRLDDRFRIVLVGTNDKIDEILPDKDYFTIIPLLKLAFISYSSGDMESAKKYNDAVLMIDKNNEIAISNKKEFEISETKQP